MSRKEEEYLKRQRELEFDTFPVSPAALRSGGVVKGLRVAVSLPRFSRR